MWELNKTEMNIKLNLLKENKVISETAYSITNNTFDFLVDKYKQHELSDSDMFWTHMSMALTRIEKHEPVEGPPEVIVQEIRQSPYKNEIEEVILFVSSKLGQEIPKEEQDYFYMHLHRVIDNNK
ncbi:hypothetical protein J6TS2_37510 [Heyndrickxia sporothermodurans]|nr:hypothetical protein J6TS2_37510 [Heyndrickxia sporothermodurans]